LKRDGEERSRVFKQVRRALRGNLKRNANFKRSEKTGKKGKRPKKSSGWGKREGETRRKMQPSAWKKKVPKQDSQGREAPFQSEGGGG